MSKRVTPAPPPVRHAAIYVRVSTEEQATEGVSLAAQDAQARAYCQLQRLIVGEGDIYRDEGVSAGKPLRERPEGARLLERIEAGEIHHVVALKLDRLFRDAVDCLHVIRGWDNRGVAVHLIDLGGQSINTTSATGRFMLTVIAGAAEMERNLIRERTRAALQFKRLRGDRLGTTPLGFRTPAPGAPMEPVEHELVAVRLILRARRRGQSFRAIAARLQREGHQTKRGGSWGPTSVRLVWTRRSRYEGHLR